jgi:hypothetical protein
MPVPIPHALQNGIRHITDRDLNILVEKVMEVTHYLEQIIPLMPQPPLARDIDTEEYILLSLRLLYNRMLRFGNAHEYRIVP